MKLFANLFSKHFCSIIAFAFIVFVGLGCGAKSDADWERDLGGRKLTMAKTSGGISDKVEIWFCPNGEYAKRIYFGGFSTGGAGTLSVADEDTEGGKFQVRSSTLILQSQDGNTSEYSISQGFEADVVELNGNKYLVSIHNECQ